MKIAVVTDDGETVSRHFGRAPYYMVFTAENGQVKDWQQVDKEVHHHGPDHQHAEGAHEGGGHSHGEMLAPIRDCEALIAGGMGYPAYQSLQSAGIKPIITDVNSMADAVKQYLAGTLVDHAERLH